MTTKKTTKKKTSKKKESQKESNPENKSNNQNIIVGVVCIAVLALVVYLLMQSGGETTAPTPVATGGIQGGDTVSVWYTGTLDTGEIFDTNIEAVGTDAGLERQGYEPLTFTVGGEGIIPGFSTGVVGMNVGDTKEVVIPPEEAYGTYDDTKYVDIPKMITINRSLVRDRNVHIATQEFVSIFQKEPVEGELLDDPNIPFIHKIESVNETGVHLYAQVTEGTTMQLDGTYWQTVVTDVNEETFTLTQNPEDGLEFPSDLGTTKVSVTDDEITLETLAEKGKRILTPAGVATIHKVAQDIIQLDFNHELAGKTLTFEVEIISVEE